MAWCSNLILTICGVILPPDRFHKHFATKQQLKSFVICDISSTQSGFAEIVKVVSEQNLQYFTANDLLFWTVSVALFTNLLNWWKQWANTNCSFHSFLSLSCNGCKMLTCFSFWIYTLYVHQSSTVCIILSLLAALLDSPLPCTDLEMLSTGQLPITANAHPYFFKYQSANLTPCFIDATWYMAWTCIIW